MKYNTISTWVNIDNPSISVQWKHSFGWLFEYQTYIWEKIQLVYVILFLNWLTFHSEARDKFDQMFFCCDRNTKGFWAKESYVGTFNSDCPVEGWSHIYLLPSWWKSLIRSNQNYLTRKNLSSFPLEYKPKTTHTNTFLHKKFLIFLYSREESIESESREVVSSGVWQ